jgi:hypothetical protein
VTLTLRRRVIAQALRPPTFVFRVLLSHAMSVGKLAAGVAAAAMVALAIMNYQDGEPAVSGYESANNETVVYRRAAPARLQSSDLAKEGEETGPQYPRAVQTIRFVNPDPPLSITAAARDMIKRALIKVGAFVAFPSRQSAEPESADMRQKRGTVVLDEIDDYLWEVYQRAPIKKDSSGDFTWKAWTLASGSSSLTPDARWMPMASIGRSSAHSATTIASVSPLALRRTWATRCMAEAAGPAAMATAARSTLPL